MNKKHLKIIFMGTAQFAVPALLALLSSEHEVMLVVTQPDRKKGRGKQLSPPPVKEAISDKNIQVFQPDNINLPDSVEKLKALKPDLIIVIAYGQLLKKQLLDIPKFGCINIHASLLPKLRGSAPINWSIINGDSETGVTSMMMDKGMDTGDMLIKRKIAIDDEINAVELAEKLSALGSETLIETLNLLCDGKLTRTPQDDSAATYSAILKKNDGLISFEDKSAKEIHNMVRGFFPWPGAFTSFGDKSMKLLKTHYDLSESPLDFEPGSVTNISRESFFIKTKSGRLEVFLLQPQDKKTMPAGDFINGYRLKIGDRFGDDK